MVKSRIKQRATKRRASRAKHSKRVAEKFFIFNVDRRAYGENSPRHVRADINYESRTRRVSDLVGLIVKWGGFQYSEAFDALWGVDPVSGVGWASVLAKQAAVSSWLSDELKNMKSVGAAPVRTGRALSPLDIADIAMTMVECCLSDVLGDDLICLLQKLLNVDRRRKSLAESRHDRFYRAADLEAQGALRGRKCGVNELARSVSVSPSAIVAWKKTTVFQEEVAACQDCWKRCLDEYFQMIKAENPELPDEEAFTRAFEMYDEDKQIMPSRGYATVSLATAREIERVEKLNYNVPLNELDDLIYSIRGGKV
jgi:hypothetical protein